MSDWVAGGIYESVDARSGGLMVGAADLEVEGGDGTVGGGEVGIEVSLSDILGENFSFLFQQSV